jgi:hypothetical protein
LTWRSAFRYANTPSPSSNSLQGKHIIFQTVEDGFKRSDTMERVPDYESGFVSEHVLAVHAPPMPGVVGQGF